MADGMECAARRQGTSGGNDPADCSWPFCGCDPHADKVIAAIEESGFVRPDNIPTSRALEIVLSRVKLHHETARQLRCQLTWARQTEAGSNA